MPHALKTLSLTSLALIAFAANSVLGRMGLLSGDIGAGSFALIRLVSGAIVLALLAGPKRSLRAGSWAGGATLFIYAAFFSYAYIVLPAGTGALLLFAMVQIVMVGAGILNGERLNGLQWAGGLAALGALGWLVSPGLDAPSPLGALAMIIAGCGWGAYSLIGRKSSAPPTLTTAGNFLRASLIACGLLWPIMGYIGTEPSLGERGILLAILSGALTSGVGYAIWYLALKSLTAIRAGLAQLTVPALAAFGGILFLNEPLTLRFVVSSLIILGGVGLATLTPRSSAEK